MGRADDAEDEKDDKAEPSARGQEPSSAPRERGVGEQLQLQIASFRARAEGLRGAELDAEVDAFLERLMERHLTLAPESMRDGMRREMRQLIETHPTMQRMLRELRAAAAR